jgi:hypothetical protein
VLFHIIKRCRHNFIYIRIVFLISYLVARSSKLVAGAWKLMACGLQLIAKHTKLKVCRNFSIQPANSIQLMLRC